MKRDKTGEFPGRRQASPRMKEGEGMEEETTAQQRNGLGRVGPGGARPCAPLEKTDPSVTSEGWPGLAGGQKGAVLKQSKAHKI